MNQLKLKVIIALVELTSMLEGCVYVRMSCFSILYMICEGEIDKHVILCSAQEESMIWEVKFLRKIVLLLYFTWPKRLGLKLKN